MLARSVVLNLIGKAVALALGFAASVVLARAIGPANRGLLGLMVSASELTLAVVGVGLASAVLYLASSRPAAARKLLGNSLLYAAAVGLVLLPIFVVVRAPLADLVAHGSGGRTWLLVAAFVPLLLVDATFQSLMLARLRFGLYNACLVGARAGYLLGVVVLVLLGGLGVTGGLLALMIGSLTMTVCAALALGTGGVPSLDRPLFRRMLGYGARVQVGTIFQIAFFRLDVVILQSFVTLKEVGHYVVAAAVAELVVQLSTAFQLSLFPLTSHADVPDAERAMTTANAVRNHGILAAAATAANVLAGPLLILFAYGPAFDASVAPMLILLPGMWFVGTGMVIAADLRGRGRPGTASLLGGATLVVVVALDLALIPPLGTIGAALASLLAYAAFGIGSVRVLSRLASIPVRRLVVPTRADLGFYLGLPSNALARLRAPERTLRTP